VTPDPGTPATLRQLLELTERALAHGLEPALAETCASLAADLEAGVVAVYLSDGEELVRTGAAGPSAAALPPELPLGSTAPVGESLAIRDCDEPIGLVTVACERGAAEAAALLATAVASARRAVVQRDDTAAHVDRLRVQATLDDLTEALNRRAFFERLDEEMSRSRQRRSDAPVTLVLFDLDHFKLVNDAHGHPAGDAVLVAFTRALEGNVRSSDAVGRLGGDEFALLLVGADEQDVDRVLDRLLKCVEAADDPDLRGVRASHGIARWPDDGATRDELIAAADARLYDHKRERGL
jgi:diguanylate cyclase (GGDEF)-like protein